MVTHSKPFQKDQVIFLIIMIIIVLRETFLQTSQTRQTVIRAQIQTLNRCQMHPLFKI
jgi:hypothetical protein